MSERGYRILYAHRLLNELKSFALTALLTVVVGALLLIALGYGPVEFVSKLLEGTWGKERNRVEVMIIATPLVLIALGYCVSFRVSWNIGGEGQYVMGAVAASAVALKLASIVPSSILVLLILLVGAIIGGTWVGIAAIIKVRFDRNEAFVTLMLNLVALSFAEWVYSYPLRDSRSGFPRTPRFADEAKLPIILHDTRLHLGVVITLLLVVMGYVLLARTTWGFRIRMVGANINAARYAGLRVKWIIFYSMAIAGGLAGLAGAIQAVSVTGRLADGVSSGYGNLAIVIAWLANKNPLLIIPVAVLLATLISGTRFLQISLGVSDYLGQLIAYMVMFTVVVVGNEIENRP
ncbi:MAG: ABC transporter permease [Anaerolineales bacterium]|nr:ABC transporter permease [Anaerolineales bacterium]